MELKRFLGIMKKKLWLIIIITSLTTLLTYSITKYYISPQYRASTLIIIGNNNTSSDMKTNVSDLNQIYAQFASTRKVATDVVNSLKLDLSPSYVLSMIEASPSQDSRFLRITATASDKTLVAPIANQYVASLKNVTKDLVNPNSVQVIDEAIDPVYPFSPNLKLNVAAAFLLGMMLSIGIIFLSEYFNSAVKNEDELSELLGAPVLGVIPDSVK